MIVRKLILVFSVLVVMMSCTSSQKMVENNEGVDDLITQRNFEIEIRSAEPQVTQAMAQVANSGVLQPGNTVARIDVTGSGYFIRVEGDSVAANLPYYGERQMGGGYGDNPGITFNMAAENIEITQDEQKKRYRVKFTVNNKVETFAVNAEISASASSIIYIRSSHRNRIRYSGRVVALEE